MKNPGQSGRQDIGRAALGKQKDIMNTNSLFGTPSSDKKDQDFDLADDLVFYMNNDPDFYRKRYFPVMLKYSKYCSTGRRVSPRGFEPLVVDAYESYRARFQTEELKLPSKLEKEVCEKICSYIHEQETKNCNNGIYK